MTNYANQQQRLPVFRGWAGLLSGIWLFLRVGDPLAAQNLFQNSGFESGTTGWTGNSSATFTSATNQAHTGARAASLQNRTATWNGVVQSVAGVLQNGNTYAVSAWVLVDSATNQSVKLTLQKTDGSGQSYTPVATVSANSNGWAQLTGNFTLNVVGTLTNLTLYIEGPAAGVVFYSDDFSLTNVPPYDWKPAANARIEQIRKRDVRLQITDNNNQMLPGTVIQVRQMKHRFAFGTAINGNISNPQYATFVRTNFEWAVMENESKWGANEPTRSNVTYTAANTLTNFCFTNGITMRGHCLFWAVDSHVQSWVTNLSDADLRVHLTNRLNSAVNHFKGTFGQWDVNNEMLHGNFYGNRLGNGINAWMFQHAQMLNPSLQLFVNDYNVVSGGETAAYKLQIQSLIASNAPVGGIGAQGHFGATVNPSLTESRLDSLAELGLPIWITEYDSLNADEGVRADNLETLYRMAFSKAAVDGVMMWGFWAGSHWRGSNATIVNLDWTLNAAGRRYQSLLAEWTTVTNGVADAGGGIGFRGFHGTYDITLTPPGGLTTVRKITLAPGAGTNLVTLAVAVTNAAPTLAVITNRTLIAGQTLVITNIATDANLPAQTLAYSLLNAPAGATINPSNGVLTWRPNIAQSPSTNPFGVCVMDNGFPSLSATQSFVASVLQPVRPSLVSPGLSNGGFSFSIAGDSGPDYTILVSSNLVTWLPVFTTNAPPTPFLFSDPSGTHLDRKFYRVLLGP